MFKKRLAVVAIFMVMFMAVLGVTACGGGEIRGSADSALAGALPVDKDDVAYDEGASDEDEEQIESDKEEESVEVAKVEDSKEEESKPAGNTTANVKGDEKTTGNTSASSNKNNNTGGSSGNSGGSSAPTSTKQECRHNWVADYKTVHHDAVTHVVHHDAITHTVSHPEEGYWTERQWVVTVPASQGGSVLVCSCGFRSDQGDWKAHSKAAEEKVLNGDYTCARYKSVAGPATQEQGYWKEPEWVVTRAAWDEVVVDRAAYDEVVVDKEAYNEQVVSGYYCDKCHKTK